VRLDVEEARSLAVRALSAIGHSPEHAQITADHLVDAALRGVTFGGLPRILAIAERMATYPDRRRPIRIVHDTPVSARIDGGDNVGYVVAQQATKLAIAKAKASGIAVVGAIDTYYTGLFAYYVEMATREGLVAMAAGNGSPMVAPHGATEPRFSTNPIAFGFPTTGDPIIWDIGTASIMQGEVMMHMRLGEPLPDDTAFDSEGRPTTDPVAALAGAVRVWGGHKGSGLATVVQLLGVLCGTEAMPEGLEGFGFFVLVIDPALLGPTDTFKSRATTFAEAVRGARPEESGSPVRMPFDRSAAERRRRLVEGVEVPDVVCASLETLCKR